jgi:hypothetical protein
MVTGPQEPVVSKGTNSLDILRFFDTLFVKLGKEACHGVFNRFDLGGNLR